MAQEIYLHVAENGNTGDVLVRWISEMQLPYFKELINESENCDTSGCIRSKQ